MHIRALGIRATIVLRDEFLSWKVLRVRKKYGNRWSMVTAVVASQIMEGTTLFILEVLYAVV